MKDEQVKKPDIDEEESRFYGNFLLLAKHSRMIVYTTVAMTGLIGLILFCLPDKFTARAVLLPPQQNQTMSGQILDALGISNSPSNSSSSLGSMAATMLGMKSPADQYVGMLKGDTVFDRIIDRFQLRERYGKKYIEDARKKLGKRADLDASKEGLITIDVVDEDPKRAMMMANAFGEELDRLLQAIAHDDAKNQLVFLEKERTNSLTALSNAEEALRTFSEKTSVIQIDAQAKGMMDYIANLRATIDAKEVQIQVMQKQATPFNYDVVRMETEVKGLKDKLKAAETQAEACYGDVCIATGKIPALGLEWLRLYREAKYQETLYQLYCKIVELARLDAARNVTVSTVQFVDRAPLPEKNCNHRLLFTAGAFVVLLSLIIFVAFMKESWQRGAQSEKEAARRQEISTYTQLWRQDFERLRSWLKRKKT
jgi:tyrosine-protein kinase Etk/Wzc